MVIRFARSERICTGNVNQSSEGIIVFPICSSVVMWPTLLECFKMKLNS